jgi:hypothetical protein
VQKAQVVRPQPAAQPRQPASLQSLMRPQVGKNPDPVRPNLEVARLRKIEKDREGLQPGLHRRTLIWVNM